MSLAPILGLAAILALSWLLSIDRGAVRLRPVLFGLALQIVLAVAVLRSDAWSHLGLALVSLWVGLFFLRPSGAGPRRLARRAAFVVPVLAAAAAAFMAVPPAFLAAFVWVDVGALALLRRRPAAAAVRAWLAALLPLAATAWAAGRGLTGLDLLALAGTGVARFLEISEYGARFLFGNLAVSEHYFSTTDAWPGFGYLFAFKLLPVIVFFAAFVSVLYFLGIVQATVLGLSRFMRWSLGTSGAETLCASANIFIGQTEAPLFIKPYLAAATFSELASVMIGGFATIAGGALAGYIALGIPAPHLIAASVLSAPAALVVAKIIVPEGGHPATAGDVDPPTVEVGANIIEAATNGIQDGLKLAVNVGAMLIGFIALMAVVDSLLAYGDHWVDGYLVGGTYRAYETVGLSPVAGEFRGVFPGSLRTLFGAFLRPVAWLVGVPWHEAASFANLLGLKLSLNESSPSAPWPSSSPAASSPSARLPLPPTRSAASPTSRRSACRSAGSRPWRLAGAATLPASASARCWAAHSRRS